MHQNPPARPTDRMSMRRRYAVADRTGSAARSAMINNVEIGSPRCLTESVEEPMPKS